MFLLIVYLPISLPALNPSITVSMWGITLTRLLRSLSYPHIHMKFTGNLPLLESQKILFDGIIGALCEFKEFSGEIGENKGKNK